MNTVYPMEEKPAAPPTYEQATYYDHDPPVNTTTTTTYGMYANPAVVMQPDGPPGAIYSTVSSAMPFQMVQTGTPIVFTTQPVIIGDVPVQCTCHNCHQMIVTRIEKNSGTLTWLVCCLVFFFVGAFGCCLIPFCIDGLKDTEHYCPHCAILLGSHRRM